MKSSNKKINLNLTESQKYFLKEQGIDLNYVFDAKGLEKSEYKIQMKASSKIIACNVTPCQKAGHTLRTRAGHCAQCNSAHLGFQKRNDDQGYVYIAGTKKGKLTKIGFTQDVAKRSVSLNKTKYGGFDDWKVLYAADCINAGELESKIKTKLKKYSSVEVYDHNGKLQNTSEIFRCSYKKAKENLFNVVKEGNYKTIVKFNEKGEQYSFPNLIKPKGI